MHAKAFSVAVGLTLGAAVGPAAAARPESALQLRSSPALPGEKPASAMPAPATVRPPSALRLRLSPALGAALAPAAAAAPGDPAAPALLDRVRLWEARNRPDLAREMLEKLFRVAPDHPDGLAARALLEARNAQPSAAQKVLARLRQVQPEHPAIAQIETLLRLNGKDKARLRQARLLARNGRTDAALAELRALYPDGPPGGDLALEYWQLLASTHKGREAARAGLVRLVKDNPDNLRYRLALAEHEALRQPLSRPALRLIIEMTRLPAHSREARAAWRQVMMRMDPAPANIPLLEEYLVHEPADSVVRARLASIMQVRESRQRLSAAPSRQDKKVEAVAAPNGNIAGAPAALPDPPPAGRPGDGDIAGSMGLARLREGRHAEARAYFRQAAQLDPGQSGKWTSLMHTAEFWGLMRESGDARDAGDLDLAEQKLREAMDIDPQEPSAIAARARLLADRGRGQEAERTYRDALAIAPGNTAALRGLISFYLQTRRTAEAGKMIAGLSMAQREALGDILKEIQAAMLREEADRLGAEGRHEQAAAVLERAVELDAGNPWLRFDLARNYVRQGRKEQGSALFAGLLAQRPGDPAVLYAFALFQSGQDEDLPALATLDRIAEADRTSGMTELQRKLWLRAHTQRAKSLVRAGQPEAARQVMALAEAGVAGDHELATTVAFEWLDLGEHDRARALLDRVAAEPAPLPVSWHLRYADFLVRIGAEAEFREELDRIAASGDLSPAEAETLADLREAAAVRSAEASRSAGRLEAAAQVLAPFLAASPDKLRLVLANARILGAANRLDAAEAGYRHALALNPDDEDARDGLIETLIRAGKGAEARDRVDALLSRVRAGDLETRLTLIGFLVDLEEYPRAQHEVDVALATAPDNPRLLAYAAQIAGQNRELDAAIDYLQRSRAATQSGRLGQGRLPELSRLHRVAASESEADLVITSAPAESLAAEHTASGRYENRRLAVLLDERSPWLLAAGDLRMRTGTAGKSQLKLWEVPVEWRAPWPANGTLFFRAETVSVSAGTLDIGDATEARSFGSLLLCQPGCAAGGAEQSAIGTSLLAGYAREDLRVDMGTTPLGFPVANLVGGLYWKGDAHPFSYSVDISRRPVTGSMLSYAGAIDPRTGAVWGGVVATGARFGLSLDKGGAFGAWSSLGLHQLTGRNVERNDRMQLMAGGYWRAINEEDRLFSMGLTGMYWRFGKNAGEYTFGHGGYFSPRAYTSLSLPITYGQRSARFSYMLRASVSSSWSETESAEYYPISGALQSQAEALAPLNNVDPHYAGSSGPGRGHAFSAAAEYQWGPRLFIGGRFEMERSAYYAPNRALFYLRYTFDHAAAQPVFLPPEPVLPSSQF